MPQQATTLLPAPPSARTAQGQPHIVSGDRVIPVPGTPAELRALRQQRTEISDQISNVSSRRDRVAKQLFEADPAARGGLQARLQVLDDRIVQLERELDVTGEAVRRASPNLVAQTQGPTPGEVFSKVGNDIVPIIAILSVFVFAPITVALSRFIWRRAAAPSRQQVAVDSAQQQRLDQLQQAVDTIAIEVERISENQRFVTKMLSDGTATSSAGARRAGASAERD